MRTNNPIPYTGLYVTPTDQTHLVDIISGMYSGPERAAAMAGACMALNLAYTLVEENYDTSVFAVPNAVDEARAAARA
jgi:hypothetical protein